MLKEVAIPQGVEVKQEGKDLIVKGPKGELRKPLRHPKVAIEVRGERIVLNSSDDRRRSKAMTGTIAAHVRNMVDGVSRGYEARLKIVYKHFPVRLKVEGESFIIENFLGEKRSRIAKLVPDTAVRTDKDTIIVTGIDKERVGTTASRIEGVTKVTGYDRRVFSDGAYITQKAQVVGSEGGEMELSKEQPAPAKEELPKEEQAKAEPQKEQQTKEEPAKEEDTKAEPQKEEAKKPAPEKSE